MTCYSIFIVCNPVVNMYICTLFFSFSPPNYSRHPPVLTAQLRLNDYYYAKNYILYVYVCELSTSLKKDGIGFG
nr:hypothetical protein Itr_chr15CG16360 [Ipomoea trifida]